EVRLEIEILYEREWFESFGALRMPVERLRGVIAAERAPERVGVKPRALVVAQDRHRVEIAVDRVARERLQRRLRANDTRRPVEFRVHASQMPEQRPAYAGRKQRAHPLLGEMEAVAAVASEALVAAVAGERNGDALARELAHSKGRQRRTVGVRL